MSSLLFTQRDFAAYVFRAQNYILHRQGEIQIMEKRENVELTQAIFVF